VLSDDRGAYEFTQLAPGEYAIDAVLQGFGSHPSIVNVAAGAVGTLDVTLAIAPLAETVTVTRTDQELSVVPAAVNVVGQDEI
jgi:hypothetical protein